MAAIASSSTTASSSPAALRQRSNVSSAAKSTTVQNNDGNSSSDDESTNGDCNAFNTFTPPSFTVKDLLGAIPKHCYERSALKSFSYVFADFAMLAGFVYLASHIDSNFNAKNGALLDGFAGSVARFVAWAAYVFCAGSVGTGVWIIAHECGHQAFSTSKALNNAVGLVLHSFLLVPYHSWRISHARHHAATGSMERDEVFIPKTRSQLGLPPADASRSQAKSANEVVAIVNAAEEGNKQDSAFEALDELFEDAPLYNLSWVILQQTLGWPLYLIKNASGQKYGRWTSHFHPSSPIFEKRHRAQIIISDIGLACTFAALAVLYHYQSFGAVVRYYILPYLVVNHHLVCITYLQHTDPNLPHYRKGEWNFQRGALCTIDRNFYGALGAFVFHGICETHVAHHVCSKIPHYNAWDATEALKNVLGEHYMKSDDNMYYSLYHNYTNCKFVEDEGQVLFYKDRFGKSQRKVVLNDEDSGVDVRGASDESATVSGSEEN